MPSFYVCPGCLHSLNNQPLALPPCRPLTTCSHCGFRVFQSVGSIARAWMAFFGLWTTFIVFGLIALALLLICPSVSEYCDNLFAGLILVMLLGGVAAFLGWLVGIVVGLAIGAAWGTRRLSGMDTLKALAAASGPQIDPRFVPSISQGSVTDSRLTGTKLCWHCGYVIDIAGFKPWAQVQCPQCRANLGSARVID